MKPWSCSVCGGQSTGYLPLENYTIAKCGVCGFGEAIPLRGSPWVGNYDDYGEYLSGNKRRKWFTKYRLFYQRYFDTFGEYFQNQCSVYDIGAGAGYFLGFCKSKGYDVNGFEPTKSLRKFALKNFDIELDSELPKNGEYSVVVSQDVIEHIKVTDLRSHLEDVKRLLRKGGLFIGNTPNFGSASILMRGSSDPVISPPHHTCYFTPDSFDSLLNECGFKKIYLGTSGFILPLPFVLESKSKTFSIFSKLIGLCMSPVITFFWPDKGYQIQFCYQLSD